MDELNECPYCEERVVTCEGVRHDGTCTAGHKWHKCSVHGDIRSGRSDHTIPSDHCVCASIKVDITLPDITKPSLDNIVYGENLPTGMLVDIIYGSLPEPKKFKFPSVPDDIIVGKGKVLENNQIEMVQCNPEVTDVFHLLQNKQLVIIPKFVNVQSVKINNIEIVSNAYLICMTIVTEKQSPYRDRE